MAYLFTWFFIASSCIFDQKIARGAYLATPDLAYLRNLQAILRSKDEILKKTTQSALQHDQHLTEYRTSKMDLESELSLAKKYVSSTVLVFGSCCLMEMLGKQYFYLPNNPSLEQLFSNIFFVGAGTSLTVALLLSSQLHSLRSEANSLSVLMEKEEAAALHLKKTIGTIHRDIAMLKQCIKKEEEANIPPPVTTSLVPASSTNTSTCYSWLLPPLSTEQPEEKPLSHTLTIPARSPSWNIVTNGDDEWFVRHITPQLPQQYVAKKPRGKIGKKHRSAKMKYVWTAGLNRIWPRKKQK